MSENQTPQRFDYDSVERSLRRIQREGRPYSYGFKMVPEVTWGEFGIGPAGFTRKDANGNPVWRIIFKADQDEEFCDPWEAEERFIVYGDIEQMHSDLSLLLISGFEQFSIDEMLERHREERNRTRVAKSE